MPTLREWFYLKPNRDNFKLKAKEDSDLILCHESEIQQDIIGNIERRFAANEPIKMLLFGDWGVGKTHTANHIGWWLGQRHDEFPAKTVMVEVGDLDKKSRFDVLVRPFIDELGPEFLIALASEYQQRVGNTVQHLRAVGVPEYIASTLNKLNLAVPGQTPPQAVMDAIHVLQGRKPTSSMASLGLGLQLTESKELFYVLYAIGYMYLTVYGHRLVFIADEAARLDEVSNDESTEAHWIAVNRDIFDDKNNVFGFIYTLTGKPGRLPVAIWHPQIQNRIGQSAVELRTLAKQDVADYVSKLMRVLVDMPTVKAAVHAGQIDASKFREATYPFDAPGLSRFLDFFERTQENAKPRDISERLDQVAFLAMKSGLRLINDEALEKANM
jgi:hypothetical protein